MVTTVEGEVWDSVKQKPLEGVKLLLVPCYHTFGSVPRVCGDAIDSARTNASGQYEIEFTTDGKADVYEVVVWRDDLFLSQSSEEVTPGKKNVITLYALELNHLKVELKVHNNPLGDITLHTAAANKRIINQNTRDTVIHTTFLPLAVNTVAFRVFLPNKGTTYRVSVDTFEPLTGP